jgi:hypothetical protein
MFGIGRTQPNAEGYFLIGLSRAQLSLQKIKCASYLFTNIIV